VPVYSIPLTFYFSKYVLPRSANAKYSMLKEGNLERMIFGFGDTLNVLNFKTNFMKTRVKLRN